MCQKSEHQEDPDLLRHETIPGIFEKARHVLNAACLHKSRCCLNVGRNQHQDQSGYRPVDGSSRQEKPACQQKHERGHFNQAATQIIQNLPT